MKLIFTEPEVLHPNSNTQTIYDVARRLEEKYGICQIFSSYIMEELIYRITKIEIESKSFKEKDKKFFILNEWLKSKWREFILDNRTGIKTEASIMREDPSFIDTGAYYLGMHIYIEN